MIQATIYNASNNGIIHNMPVVFSYLSFGAGTVSHPIPGPYPTVTLGVKGTPQGVATAALALTSARTRTLFGITAPITTYPTPDLGSSNNTGRKSLDQAS